MFKKLSTHTIPLVLLILFIVLSSVLFLGLRKYSQSFYFQDETEHVTMGWMMNNFGRNLYTDLSTNHQPIPIFFGAVVMKIVSYDTLFVLIERIRIVMFGFFFLTGLGLVFRFRERGLFAFLLTFALGYYYFAWHVLAESLAAPAVLFLVLLVCEKLFTAVTTKDAQKGLFDIVIAAISLVWIGFNLLPLWPFCLLVAGYLFFMASKQERIYGVVTALVCVAFVFSFVSPEDWYRESVDNNIRYFIGFEEARTTNEWLTILFYPFLVLLKPGDPIAQMFIIPLILMLGSLVFHLYKNGLSAKSIKTILAKIIFVYIFLISLNPRVYDFPVAFYIGFHLFPYVAAFFAIFASSIFYIYHPKKQIYKLALVGLVIPLFALNAQWSFSEKDKLNEYYVQYGTYESYAQLVRVFKADGDTFFSAPNGHGYLNIISGLPIAGRQLFHLEWAYRSPQLRSEFHELFKTNLPIFVYLTEDTSGYHTELVPILKSGYSELLHDAKRTHLYFSKQRVAETTEQQAQYMKEKDFTFAQQ